VLPAKIQFGSENIMRNIRTGIVVLLLLVCCSATSVSAQVSIGIGLPNVSIGINLPIFPELVPMPGYPVYYAPRLDANYFFYDGMYWVYTDDYWYASNWYNGPWSIVEPAFVPLYILRVPVRYYRQPPVYFRGWHRDAPPRWGNHWGHDWERQHRGWDKWNRSSAPTRAPLPAYQRQYSGDRYPRGEQQHDLHREQYRYQPRDKAVRQNFQQQGDQRSTAPARRERQEEPRLRNPGQPEIQRPAAQPQPAPAIQRPQPQPRSPVYQEQRQEPRREQRQESRPEQRQEPRYEQQPRPQVQEQRYQERERQQEPRGQGREQRQDEGRGRGRD
jgi:hypothetical protein